jgi:hypothetical protein
MTAAMIAPALADILAMAIAVLGASVAGLALARAMPWSLPAQRSPLPEAFGLALAPLILGLVTVAALALLPRAGHSVHAALAAAGLASLALAPRALAARAAPWQPRARQAYTLAERVLAALLIAWIAMLVRDALFAPLTQNDALEYAMVGRLLYETPDLALYPVLDPASSASGFYAPWTHPPLYVALIYLTNVLQGHAAEPGLMRLIAPWCLLTAAGLTYALGSLTSRAVGLLAAIVAISAPLLFLGAGAALIDPLPVVGLTLVLATTTPLAGTSRQRALLRGLVLGLALWTHSQAVLFIPLAILGAAIAEGWRDPRSLLAHLGWLLLAAAAVGVWPYGRNVLIYGSPVSDNPLVFALPSLAWPEYFRMQRGYESWSDIVQYGVLKGWFAVEAYALSFWLMTWGAVLYLRSLYASGLWRRVLRGDTGDVPDRIVLVSLGMVACYVGGAAVSSALGIDLMIRNERYLLVLLPCAGLIAGWGLAPALMAIAGPHPVAGRARGIRAIVTPAVVLGLLMVLWLQWLVVGGYRATSGWTANAAPEGRAFAAWPAYGAVDYLARETPPGAVVLSMKPADMYYANRRMVSYLDPRLLAFYGEREPRAALGRLRDLGITHLHVPDYWLPPVYNSALEDIMARPSDARLVHASGGYQIYELAPSARMRGRARTDPPVFAPWSWMQERELLLGGRKALARVSLSSRPLRQDEISSTDPAVPAFLRERTTRLVSAPNVLDASVSASSSAGEREFRLDLAITGQAFAQIHLISLDRTGRAVRTELLGELPVTAARPRRVFTRRFLAEPDIVAVRIAVEHRGKSWLRIENARLEPVTAAGG